MAPWYSAAVAANLISLPTVCWRQKRKPPNKKTTMVAAAEVSSDATQPKRFEKKKNTLARF
jgi:hypothetical protein